MSRSARIVIPYFPHHVVQRGNNRQQIFLVEEDFKIYYGTLQSRMKAEDISVLAYCLMPNHVHLLLEPKIDGALAKAMHRLNTFYSHWLNKKYGRTGSLWEGRFYSAIVSHDSYFWNVCRYIERNPVRANIVRTPDTYEWSSAKFNMGFFGSHLLKNPLWRLFDPDNQMSYRNFISSEETQNDLDLIRRSTNQCKVYGNKVFIDRLAKRTGRDVYLRSRGRQEKNDYHIKEL